MAKYGYMAKIGADTSGLQSALKDINSSLAATDREINATNKAISAAEKAGVDSSDVRKQKEEELQEAIDKTAQKLIDLKTIEEQMNQAHENGNISTEEHREYQREISNTESRLRSYQTELRNTQEAEKNTSTVSQELAQKMDSVKTSVAKVADDLKQFAEIGAAVAAAVGGAAVAVGKYAVDVGSSFESAMSNVQAYSGAQGEAFERLGEAAKEAGATTSKTATEAAQALGYMALAGWDTEDMLKGLMPILRASEAGGADLARTSDLVTDSMSAMGISADELSHYLNVCTSAQSNSNTTLSALLEAYIGCGGTLRNLNVDIEESAAWLGVLANRGKKASEAGTAFNSILVNLVGANKSAASALDALGISAWDENGNFIGLTETIQALSDALADCTEQQRSMFEAKIGGKTQMDTLQALISGVNEEFYDLKENLENSASSLEDTATTMQDNLAGSVTIMKSALEGVGTEIYEYLNAPLRSAVDNITSIFSELNTAVTDGELKPQLEALSQKIGEFLSKIAEFAAEKGIPMLIDGIDKLVDGLSWFVDNLGTITDLAKGLGAAWVTWQLTKVAVDVTQLAGNISSLATVTTVATAEQTALNTAMKMNLFGAVAAAAIAAVTAIASLVDRQAEALRQEAAYRTELQETYLAITDETRAMSDSVKSADEKADKLEKLVNKLKEWTDASGKVIDKEQNVAGVLQQINDLTGSNLTLMGDQVQGYKDLADSMDDYIEKLRIEAQLSFYHDDYIEAIANIDDQKEKTEQAKKNWQSADKEYQMLNDDIIGRRNRNRYISDYDIQRLEELKAKRDDSFNVYGAELNKEKTYQSTIDKYEEIAGGKSSDTDAESPSKEEAQRTAAQSDAAAGQEKTKELREKRQSDFDAEIEALDRQKKLHKNGLDEDENYYKKKKEIIEKYKPYLTDSESFWSAYDDVDGYYSKKTSDGGKNTVSGGKKNTEKKTKSKSSETQKEDDTAAKQAKSDIDALAKEYEDGLIDRERFNEEYFHLQQEWAENGVDIEEYAAEKTADVRKKSAKSDFDALVKMLDNELITREEFNTQYAELEKEWSEDSVDIHEYTSEKISEINKKELDSWEKNAESTVKSITGEFETLEKKREQLADKIAGGNLAEQVTDTKGKKRYIFADVTKRTDQIKKYMQDFKRLKSTDIPGELLNEILSMDFSERAAVIEELLNMKKSSRDAYYSDYTEYKTAQKNAAAMETEDEYNELVKTSAQAYDELYAELPQSAYESGKESANKYITGLYDGLKDYGGAAAFAAVLGNAGAVSVIDHTGSGAIPAGGTSGGTNTSFISGDTAINIVIGSEVIRKSFRELMRESRLGRSNIEG